MIADLNKWKPKEIVTWGFLMVCACTFPLWSQEQASTPRVPVQLTLNLAMEMLLVSNPTLLRERQNVAIARADVIGARQRPNPEFNLGSESYPLFESNPGPFFSRQEMVVSVGQTIETAGKRRKRTKVAKQDVVVAQSLLQDTIRQLKLELQRRYYSVVLAKAEYELARQVLSEFDEIIRLNEVRYEKGEVSGLDLTRVQTERLRFFDDQLASKLQLQNAKTAVLELLGVQDMTADFDVAEKLEFQPLEVTLASLQEEALQARADLSARRQHLERERLQLRLEKSRRIPNLTPFFGYKRDLDRNTVAFGMAIALPLFNRNQGGIARLQAHLSQERHELERVELAVRSEVQQAYQVLQTQVERIRALEDFYVAKAKRARDIAQASYRLGALDLITFLDAERAYRETLRAHYQAFHDHQVAVFSLQAAVGGGFQK